MSYCRQNRAAPSSAWRFEAALHDLGATVGMSLAKALDDRRRSLHDDVTAEATRKRFGREAMPHAELQQGGLRRRSVEDAVRIPAEDDLVVQRVGEPLAVRLDEGVEVSHL